MAKWKSEWPEKNELVMCTAKKIFDQGAYLELDEYKGKEGMVHISEISSGWVKNIRRHIREGQKTICKVLNVNVQKGHINLSMRRVKESQRRWKSQQRKRDNKAKKLLEQAAKRVGSDINSAYEKIGFFLQDKYDDIYSAFEEVAMKGRDAVEWPDVEEEWIDALVDLIKSTVEPPSVNVTGYVDLKCPRQDGIEVIKSALNGAKNSVSNSSVEVKINYMRSPSYSVSISAPSYKVAEKVLREVAKNSISAVEEAGGMGEFHADRKK